MADEKIPEHRTTVTPRSGDTHVIGDDGAAVNVDEVARVLRQAQDDRAFGSEKAAKTEKAAKAETGTGKTDAVT